MARQAAVPPTSAAGLEDGVVDKKSDDDWLIADPVPLTETEMVGTFLQDQEETDREQYVFLTQEDANMETVKDTLSELTEHIHRLSVGDFQADVAGQQTDGPKRVEVEPAGDGFFRLTCFPEPFPVASSLVPPYSPIVHLNLPSQYQLKKHQWWPFSIDGTAAHAYSPVEGMASR